MSWQQWDDPDAVHEGASPPPVHDLVEALSSARGWEQRLRGARVHQAWDDIAGPELARHVQPVRLAGGVLVVRAESPAWATQVRYLATALRDRANEVLGSGEVSTVTVQTGPVEDAHRKKRP